MSARAGLLLIALVCWTGTCLAAAAAPQAPGQEPLVFGVILVGPSQDHGWSEAHFQAGKYVEAKLQGVRMIYVDNVNPAAKPGVTVPQLVDDLLSKGARLILTTSDDFQDGTLEAARKFPKIPMINISGDQAWKAGKNPKAPANLSNIMGRMEYGKMMMGCAAALSTQTGKLGYLGPLINDETRRLAVSAFLGARHCWTEILKKKPQDLQFKVTWIGFWFNIPGQTLDPSKVSADFYRSGYDVVLSGIDTTEALVEARKLSRSGKKVWAVPYDFREGCKEAEEVCLGVAYFNWGPSYLRAVKRVLEGKWAQFWEWNGPDWKDINNPVSSAIGFVKGKALSAPASARLDGFIRALGDGSLQLFKGPLRFQDKTVYLKAGEVAFDRSIWYLPSLLEGMDGSSQ